MFINMEVFTYRKLLVYQRSKDFVKQVYCLLKLFPKEEQYALCDQLRRASISIASNIAEGMGRSSLREQVHFIEIAYGSLNEVMCQLELSEELGYITIKDLQNLEVQYEEIARMLSGLRKSKIIVSG
jgi:four helix bundle protein